MTKDNNSKGIILIIIAMTLFAMQDSLIKYIFDKNLFRFLHLNHEEGDIIQKKYD